MTTPTNEKIYKLLLTHCNICDVITGTILEDYAIGIDFDGKIAKIEASSKLDDEDDSDDRYSKLKAQSEKTIQCVGCYTIPGLIDCHVHVTAFTANFGLLEKTSPSYVTGCALKELEAMLRRGFTTVRDAGGADHGLARVVQEKTFPGPRLLFCGKALSQTGGHGDMREPGNFAKAFDCSCAGLGRICDGDTEVRRAARDEIRKGATHIKVMAGGGVSSPTDRITSTQFSLMELKAIVEEATAANIHVMAHAYTPKAILNCVKAGIKSIEHGNLLNEEAAKSMNKAGTYLVPTLATYDALAKEGKKDGLNEDMEKKIYDVLDAGKKSIGIAKRANVTMCYGSDLLAGMRKYQLSGLSLLNEAGLSPLEVIRSATINAANLIELQDEIGSIEIGKYADVLVLDRNPFQTITNWSYKAVIQQGIIIN